MKLLWICFVWPEPVSSAAGIRTMQLLTASQKAGYDVVVCSPCQANPFQQALAAAGFAAHQFEPNDSRFDAYLQSFQPDVVVFDRFIIEEQFSWRVREHCPQAVRVLDTIDLHSLRRVRERRSAKKINVLQLELEDFHEDDSVRELASIYRSDLSLIVSDAEVSILRDSLGIPSELLSLCRIGYQPHSDLLDFHSRSNIVMIGNFHHAPNIDSYRLLQGSLWPMIKRELESRGIDDVELHIYGAYPTAEFLQQDNQRSGFRVRGWVEDAQAALSQYRVNLAPLQFGAGIKGKIADGWCVGTPCVSTSVGAEGMTGGLPFGGVVHDDFDNFATSVADLYTAPDLWQKAQQRGIDIIRRLFNPETEVQIFLSALEKVINHHDQIRNTNLVGSLLWHQQHRSTEYFSRWIELKNTVKGGS